MQPIRTTLAADFETYSIDSRLHNVPPHEVCEVTVDGRRAVYKRDTGRTGSAAVEGHVTAFVGEQTSIPVPAVLAVGEDHFVAEWHPDAPKPDAGAEPDEAWARAAGRGLAALHDETAPHLDGYGQFAVAASGGQTAGLDALAGADRDDWHGAAVAYVHRLEGVLSEFGHCDVAAAAREFLQSHPDAFAGAGAPVCCHGWWAPDHVAVRNGEVACVLDFEHAIAAPGEWDYWRTVLPTFDGGAPQKAFREGYESVRSLPDGFERRRPLYELLHTLYFFESLYVQDQHGDAETAERADRLRGHAFGLLDGLDSV